MWSETDRQLVKNRNDLREIGVFLTTLDRGNEDGYIIRGHRYPALLRFTPDMKLAAIEVRDLNTIRSALALADDEVWPVRSANRKASNLANR